MTTLTRFNDFITTIGNQTLFPLLNDNEIIKCLRICTQTHSLYKRNVIPSKLTLVFHDAATCRKKCYLTNKTGIVFNNIQIHSNKLADDIFNLSHTFITRLSLHSLNSNIFPKLTTFLLTHTIKSLRFDKISFTEQQYQTIYDSLHHLEHFEMKGNPKIQMIEMSKWIHNNRQTLKNIVIIDYPISYAVFVDYLIPSLKCCSKLEILLLLSTDLQDNMIPSLVDLIATHDSLSVLNVSYNNSLTDDSIALLCSPLLGLESLGISQIPLKKKSFDALIANDVLTDIRFDYSYFSSQQRQWMSELLLKTKGIFEICLDNFEHQTKESKNDLIGALLFNTTIQHIFLGMDQVEYAFHPLLASIAMKNRQIYDSRSRSY